MKVIKIDLPQELKEVEVHTLADLHIGDKFSNKDGIKERIEYIKNTPNASNISRIHQTHIAF